MVMVNAARVLMLPEVMPESVPGPADWESAID